MMTPSLHMLCHVVSVMLIAALVKQLMQGQYQPRDGDMMAVFNRNVSGPEHLRSISYSSVWCMGKDASMCHFKNLCYNSAVDDFVIFITNDSVFENVHLKDGSVLVDLSSVKDHNAQQISIVRLPFHTMARFTIQWINRTSLLFNRFKPDNLMHVLHDDILPLHHTLRTISMDPHRNHLEPFNVQVVFSDGWKTTPDFDGIYQMFSDHRILVKESLSFVTGLTCFADIYLGISRTTVWYDYGFTQPQGPIPSTTASANHIHSTVQYMANNMKGSTDVWVPDNDYIILLNREDNRKIFNAMELILEITTQIGMKVINLNFESYSFNELVHFVQKSKGLIGMHGSLLSLAIFLSPGSVLVELFPYAVNPDNYTPYKTLAGLPGMRLVYKSWMNVDVQRTVGHPDWEPELGGVDHLPEDERNTILSQTDVPTHVCCSDPSWLYHIYQDTVVDIPAVISLVRSSLSHNMQMKETHLQFHPSKVKNITCILYRLKSNDYQISISWTEPWTVYYTDHSDISFDILVQRDDLSSVQYHKSRSTLYVMEAELAGKYYVWVRCVDGMANGPYSDGVLCSEQDN